MDQATIEQLATLIVGPIVGLGASIIAYMKVSQEREKTGEARDATEAMVEKRISDLEKKVTGIDELKESIQQINLALAKIQTLIEIYIARSEK